MRFTTEATTPAEPDEPGQEVEPKTSRELAREIEAGRPTLQNGYLTSERGLLHVQAYTGSGDDKELGLLPWGNFNITPLGTSVEPDGTRSWIVTISVNGRTLQKVLDHETASRADKLNTWLAGWGAVIATPPTAYPPMSNPARLIAYLDTTSPGEAIAVPHLGWYDRAQAFVTPTHVIRAGAHAPGAEVGVLPSPKVSKRSDDCWHWGFEGDPETARQVLREVLTWQEETVAAVFGAWWAATLLKGQTIRRTSIFPSFAIEAPGGGGKTLGFFQSMVELSGNWKGTDNPTPPAFRNRVSTARSGIVWADDLTDASKLFEIIRASTAEGRLTKSGADMDSNDGFPALAPIFLSGTGLGLGGSAEYAERFVGPLHPPRVGDRTSLKPGREGQRQYDDVVELRSQYPEDLGLSVLAGWYVEAALGHVDEYLDRMKRARSGFRATGRSADKFAILAAGAWLLDQLADNGTWAQDLVAAWSRGADRAAELTGDDELTRAVIPWALRRFGAGKRGELLMGDRVPLRGIPPVIVEPEPEGSVLPDRVYVNTQHLHDYRLDAHPHDPDYARLYTAEAMGRQLGRVSLGRSEPGARISVSFRDLGERVTYAQLKPEYAEAVLARWHRSGGEEQ